MDRPLPGRRSGAARSLVAAARESVAAAPATRAGDRGIAAVADDRRRDLPGARSAALDGVVVAETDRLGKRSRLEPPEPANRYERRHPGELVHVDIKKLARISARVAGHRFAGHRGSQFARRAGNGRRRRVTGFEYLHVMIDDHSRLGYAEVLDGLTAVCAIAFLHRAVAWFAERGVRIQAVMTDNGSCYVADAYAVALRELRLRQLRIRPYRPRTNGKAERFIQTLLNEWAYVRIYGSSEERRAALPGYL